MRDNFGRFRKHATINFTKRLQSIANKTQTNLQQIVADKLLETYKNNVTLSYKPRSNGTYDPDDDTLLDSIGVDINDNKVQIVIREEVYSQLTPRTTTQVHKFLTEGTKGGGTYPYIDKNGVKQYAYNYPTPKHDFEEHTQIQMNGFLQSLTSDIQKGKYSK